jgi:hypothetical protein
MVVPHGALKCLPTFTLFISLSNFFTSTKTLAYCDTERMTTVKRFMVMPPDAVRCLSIFSLFLDLSNFFISYKISSLL